MIGANELLMLFVFLYPSRIVQASFFSFSVLFSGLKWLSSHGLGLCRSMNEHTVKQIVENNLLLEPGTEKTQDNLAKLV